MAGADAPSCFFLRVAGESMVGAGIHDGDVLVVDKAAEPTSGAVVVASVDGELTVKRFVRRGVGRHSWPPTRTAHVLADRQGIVVWGVV